MFSRWRFDLLFIAVLAALTAALYGRVTTLWWTYDDFFHLHHILTHPAEAYLLDTKVWREMPNRLFTPLQMLSYEVDLASFGLAPRPFYLHQTVALGAATVALYGLLRLWLSKAISLSAACLFLAGVPINSWAQQLMVRHYVEGLFFALLATILFVLACLRRSLALSAAASVSYFCASAAKEIYVPLPLLLVLLPVGTVRQNLRYAVPQLLAGTIYLWWRFVMLGTIFGGYGWAVTADELPKLLVQLPVKMLRAMSPPGPAQWAFAAAIVLLLAWTARIKRRLLFVTAAAVSLLLPLLVVSTVFEERFAGLPWLLVACAFGVAVQDLAAKRGARVGLLAAVTTVAIVIVANRLEWRSSFASAHRMSVEGRFLADANEPVLLRQPKVPPAAMVELKSLKKTQLRRSGEVAWFYDDIFLCDHPSARAWQYDKHHGRVVEISLAEHRQSYCRSIRWTAPLEAVFHKTGRNLFWTLGPYERGSYALLLGDGVSMYEMPRSEGFQIGAIDELALRVRYISPEGWVTYSPELQLNFKTASRFEWRR